MTVNAEVSKGSNENSASLIRRFTKRARGAGTVRKIKSSRYFARSLSKYTKKRRALKSIERRDRFEESAKQGLLPPQKKGRGRRFHAR